MSAPANFDFDAFLARWVEARTKAATRPAVDWLSIAAGEAEVDLQTTPRSKACGRCGVLGHNQTTCTAVLDPVLDAPIVKLPLADRLRQMHDDRRARIADRTEVGTDETGDRGRRRYHGKERRGRQTNRDKAIENIDLAVHSLLRARDGFESLVNEMPPSQSERRRRDEAIGLYLGHADHAVRFLEELFERYNFVRLSLDEDDDPTEVNPALAEQQQRSYEEAAQ